MDQNLLIWTPPGILHQSGCKSGSEFARGRSFKTPESSALIFPKTSNNYWLQMKIKEMFHQKFDNEVPPTATKNGVKNNTENDASMRQTMLHSLLYNNTIYGIEHRSKKKHLAKTKQSRQ